MSEPTEPPSQPPGQRSPPRIVDPTQPHDLLLSSGFLAFARHAGFLAAIEQSHISIDAVCGTSSGALVGALWAAGHPARQILQWLGQYRPVDLMAWSWRLWRGLFSTRHLVDWLKTRLPSTFAELSHPFAVGVGQRAGPHCFLREGPLPEAVAASCAMPYVFHAVTIGHASYHDGGARDRVGIDAWREWRGERQRGIVHWVERTNGREVSTDTTGLVIVRTPKSGASFWRLGDVVTQAQAAAGRTAEVLGVSPTEALGATDCH